MDTNTLYPVLKRIYAAFNRNAPYQASEQFLSILERVNRENIPSVALDDIARKISDYETIPQNIGRAFIKEFREWLSSHPDYMDGKQKGCDECLPGGLPGFVWAYRKNGGRVVFKCKCNTSETFSSFQYVPKREIGAKGFILQKTDEKWRPDNLPPREERAAFLKDFIASIPDIPKKTDNTEGDAGWQACFFEEFMTMRPHPIIVDGQQGGQNHGK